MTNKQAAALPWITPSLLRTIAPAMSQQTAQTYAPVFAELCPKFGMDTRTEFEEFIANVLHETGSLTQFSENMNYSAQRLSQVWPGRYQETYVEKDGPKKVTKKRPNSLAVRLSYRPEAIANNVYANRMGNGNEASGDGWRFRGGGGLHSTGRSMYQKGATYFKLDVADYAAKIRTEPEWVAKSALFVFCIEKQLLDEATRNEALAICIAINGGKIGWEEREVFRKRAKSALGC